jgi:putative peptidoglycan lipid II flippase
VLWFAARFAAAYFSQAGALRDEAALLLLVVAGALVYAGSILALFGWGWLRSLMRS